MVVRMDSPGDDAAAMQLKLRLLRVAVASHWVRNFVLSLTHWGYSDLKGGRTDRWIDIDYRAG